MKQISSFNIKERFHKQKVAPHTKAALVDEIVKVVGVTENYNYVFWLSKVKQFEKKGGKVGDILDWLKEINTFPSSFNKGGCLTNKIKNYGRKSVQSDGENTPTISSEKRESDMEESVVQK